MSNNKGTLFVLTYTKFQKKLFIISIDIIFIFKLNQYYR